MPSILPLVGAGGSEREATATDARRNPRGEPEEVVGLPAPKAEPEQGLPAGADSAGGGRGKVARPHLVTCDDPRLPDVEKLLDLGDWARVVDLLGPPEAAGRLPPPLGLAYAVAPKEVDAVSLAAPDESVQGPNQLARRCMASLLAVSEESPLALVLSRRMLRQNPISWRRRRAPAAPLSIVIVLLALFLGASIGYVLNFGRLTLSWPGG